jgi:sarcosine oxidase, subunit gamma
MQKEHGIMSNNLELNLTQFSPTMQSPLQHFELHAKQENTNSSKGVWANEIALLGYISLRGNCNNAAFTQATNSVLGVALPTLPCSLIDTPWGGVYWLAPDEWLIVCERAKRIEIQQKLEAALVGMHSQVLDNSGGFTSVLLQGNHADDALQHCTSYDLHALQAGKIVGTTFGKLSVYLVRQNAGYKLIFRRSYADYIWRYLERAATPYGFGISKI